MDKMTKEFNKFKSYNEKGDWYMFDYYFYNHPVFVERALNWYLKAQLQLRKVKELL